jgi:uncharacterized membrane-anchored protein YjiN (DUF445 family)
MKPLAEGPGAAAERRTLARHRAFATGLLVLAAAIFAAIHTVEQPGFWLLLTRAGAEAAMVGGLADWFAVTALFRRPLGLPIPHTALIPRNKDRLGENLARFVEENFLAPDLVAARLAALDLAARAAGWLATPRNAAAMAERIVAAVPFVVTALGDRDVREFVRQALSRQLAGFDLAPALGRLLRVLTEGGQHQQLFDRALAIARELLIENEPLIRAMVAERSQWWIPKAIDERIAAALIAGISDLLADLADKDHEARRRFDAAVEGLIGRLEASPATAERVEAIKARVLASPEAQEYLASLWDRLREAVLADAAAERSAMRRGLAGGLVGLGEALGRDGPMRERLNRRIESTVATLVVPWRREIGALIADVVRGWDAATVTDRLERAVGPDLQYIRVNGTLVGALVGCALFLITRLLA